MNSKQADLIEDTSEMTKEDLKNYWSSLFPELNTLGELDDLLKELSNKDLETFYEERKKNEKNKDEKIEKFFEKGTNSNFYKYFDSILNEQQKKERWAYFYKPILKRHTSKLFNILHKSSLILDTDIIFNNIIIDIIKVLINKSFRVLVLETNIASTENRLLGKTKYDRSNYFCQVLLNNEEYLKEVYSIYPELVRLMDEYVSNSIKYIDEIISNTETEYPQICKAINNNKILGKIVSIEFGKGDSHNKNKSVAKIKFDTETIVIYKPRKLDIETKFNSFIEWVNKTIPNVYPLKSCKSHTVENGGWMECIENIPCKTDEEIKRFYNRMGQFLCILYTLNSKDFHYENIIANGEYPILIDLETLLHLSAFSYKANIENVETYIMKIIEDSVVGIGLLPTLFQNSKSNEVMEVGGLGSTCKRVSPFKTQILKNFDADDIHVGNICKEIPPALNNPKLDDVIIGSENYVNEIRSSFEETYNWILNNKFIYLNQIKKEFYELKNRFIYKNTNKYVQLMETSYHPDLLHNKSDREIYFHRIGLMIDKSQPFVQSELYKSEIREMLSGDVPMFFTNIKNTFVTNNNNEIFNNVYNKSIFNTIEDKINNLTSIDMYRQLSLINQSFIGCKLKTDLPNQTQTVFKQYHEKMKSNELLTTSIKLGDLIIDRSISKNIDGKTYRSWIGLQGFGDDFYNISQVGNDLYVGNGGILIFLSYLAKVTQDDKYIPVVKSALGPIIKNLKEINSDNPKHIGLGAFTGITSYYYAIYMCIKQNIFNEKESENLILLLESKLNLFQSLINEEDGLDIINGLSGALGVLISIYNIVSSNSKIKILELCDDILNKLKESAIVIDDDCITWSKDIDIGYAHGNAGVISQLMRLYKLTSDKTILTLIQKSLVLERRKFDSKSQKWIIKQKAHYYSWCNGIGGLLLSKLLLHQLGYSDDDLLDEISLIINQLKEVGFGTDYSICHGDIGSLSLLYYAASVLKDDSLKETCSQTLYDFNKNFVEKNWVIFEKTEDWGLMTGASGVGLGLSSLYNDNIISNILLLQ